MYDNNKELLSQTSMKKVNMMCSSFHILLGYVEGSTFILPQFVGVLSSNTCSHVKSLASHHVVYNTKTLDV